MIEIQVNVKNYKKDENDKQARMNEETMMTTKDKAWQEK